MAPTFPDRAAAIALAAQALVEARRSGRPQPSVDLPDAEAAFDVQARVADALGWVDGPALPRHWKSGAVGPGQLAQHAALPPAGVWASPAIAGRFPLRRRGIEAEVAVRLAEDVDAGRAAGIADARDAAALVDAMAAAIEVVDSRWAEGLDAPLLAKLADLQSHAALVLGPWAPFAPRDWASQACRVTIGPAAPRVFRGTHSLGDPLAVLPAWLRHATRDGRVLRAGSVVTTGTWCGLLDASAEDRVAVEFPGIGAAAVLL